MTRPNETKASVGAGAVIQALRTCAHCTFCVVDGALWLQTLVSGFPRWGTCANQPEAPGQWRPVPIGRCCRNFRLARQSRVEPPEPPNDEIRYIPLTHGLHAIVDAEDYESLSKHKWYAHFSKRGSIIYAARAEKYTDNGRQRQRTILMHREIMKPPPEMVIDHIDSNGIHNRRCNLRSCTQAQNIQHSRPRTHGESRFRGVFPYRGRWRATVTCAGQLHYVGTFDDEEVAARARDRKAIELSGEFAVLNFPQEREEG